jgi:hypothetical protein
VTKYLSISELTLSAVVVGKMDFWRKSEILRFRLLVFVLAWILSSLLILLLILTWI